MEQTRTLRLRKARYWLIALLEENSQWAAWLAGNFIAVGWDELGDIANLTRQEFAERVAALRQRFPERSKSSADQVWRFAHHIREGDRIVVSAAHAEILGVGIVTGPYYFVPDVDKGHCLPVEWIDRQRRAVQLPAWRRTVVELKEPQFEAVLRAPVLGVATTDQGSPLDHTGKTAEHRVNEASAPYFTSAPFGSSSVRIAASNNVDTVAAQARQPIYNLATLATTVGYSEATLLQWLGALERKGQVILAGPPGVGKTFLARELARHVVSGGDGFFSLLQFHPAYAYEDFVQGLRPKPGADGHLEFQLEPGRFLNFCRQAAERRDRCVLIIDEINRANLARVFGELLYLLEYREEAIPLAGSNEHFAIPANVRMIGTMNTADRSIALVDFALRRRFAFIEMEPNYELLASFHAGGPFGIDVRALIKLLKRVNLAIGDRRFAIGVAPFLRSDLANELAAIWTFEIEPFLAEFFFDQPEVVADFCWSKVSGELEL